MKKIKCSKCKKPAEYYLKKKVGFTAVCKFHYLKIKEKREKKKQEKNG